MNRIRLGNTNIHVSPVGMGTLTMGFSQKNLPLDEGARLIVYAVRSGINFLDTAQYYDTYRYLRPALDEIKTDSSLEIPVICSKTLEPGYDGASAAVDECLEKLGLEQIDIFLLHEVRGINDLRTRADAWQALRDKKAAGLIKAIGISTHHIDACMAMADISSCDVVFPLINKSGMGIRNGEESGTREQMAKAINKCSRLGIGVFTMKAFGGGNLIENYVDCLDYVTSLEGVDAVMIGMGSYDEVDTAVEYFESRLDRAYHPDISRKRMMVDQSDCEGCGTCKARCVSEAIFWNKNGLAEINVDKCVRCGYCAPVCPVRAIVFL
ncbi:aldo/keto reductase [Mogibacterium timidum]|uniref:4Fe-4S binding domain protein n=1 Tax=Mogibacterium timidum ATCC 33093 TaxID=1401079 RepID=X8J940_9FIRM|nr:aldo/keto reductase [Mogibacterium timidum]EUC58049.1 4Fe-4S binding domain protein [Mogibacterium timidum ATCC 33093]